METPLNGKSFLSQIDPRIKIVTFLILAWTIALSKNLTQALVFLPLALLFFLPLLSESAKILKYLLFADLFLLFVVVTQFLFGSPYLGILIFFKSTIIVALSLFLLSTSSVFDLLHALHHLKIPNRLLQLLFFFYRYLFSLYEQYKLTLKSTYSRGFTPKTSRETYRTYAYIIGNLIIKSYFKSERIYKALLSRGFNGYFPVYRHFELKQKDIIFLFSVLLYWGIVTWKFYLHGT
ncbi:cobalt/nickel transport system permease protein [Balnearium lithotrophicum]|uniref:Cobalt/nickel transport system permease protein n=1 Tax=Balnearium lithotrophicum TaxID=223788 RepID=A0A521D497_9BACT|nr:energy-coupling factor transporter transmembrane component T [Balnearium lithotrophicum]SMO66528.1 cobalt/nickel transport system permease protein [Balnearium lithotrophicum]